MKSSHAHSQSAFIILTGNKEKITNNRFFSVKLRGKFLGFPSVLIRENPWTRFFI